MTSPASYKTQTWHGLSQHPRSGVRHFTQLPDSPRRTLDIRTHQRLFDGEDGPAIFGSFPNYDRDAVNGPLGHSVEEVAAEMKVLGFEADFTKQDPINFRFKNHLQRPRPMQMALRFRFFDFEYLDVATSITPTMCSGHWLQGVLDGGSVLERLLVDGAEIVGPKGGNYSGIVIPISGLAQTMFASTACAMITLISNAIRPGSRLGQLPENRAARGQRASVL